MQPTRWTLWSLLSFLALLGMPSVTVAVTVTLGKSATISCRLNCSTVEWWTKYVEAFRIFWFADGKCNVVPEFADRIECSAEKIRRGDVSLIINPVVYNDRGWYYNSCDGKYQCDRKIEVIVPASQNVSVGGKCKIPCYTETDKRTPDSSVYIQWEKDGQQVVKLEQGKMVYGPGFEQRVAVSAEGFRKGDLSLTISDVRQSDSGLYRCSVKDEEYGYPNSVTLSVQAHWFEHHEKEGDSALLNLVMPQLVMVYFSRLGAVATEIWICSTTNSAVHCKTGYDHRASIINASLMLSELTVADSGMYTVKNIKSEVIAVHELTVIGLPSSKFPVAALCASCGLLAVVLSVVAFRACQRKKKQLKTKEEHEMRGTDEETVQLSVQQSDSSYRSPLPWPMKSVPSLPPVEDRPEEEDASPTQATADQGVQDEQG